MADVAAAAEAAAGMVAQGVNLPPPVTGALNLEEVLARRRAVREFTPGALTLAEISWRAQAAQGVAASMRDARISNDGHVIQSPACRVDGSTAQSSRELPYAI